MYIYILYIYIYIVLYSFFYNLWVSVIKISDCAISN